MGELALVRNYAGKEDRILKMEGWLPSLRVLVYVKNEILNLVHPRVRIKKGYMPVMHCRDMAGGNPCPS